MLCGQLLTQLSVIFESLLTFRENSSQGELFTRYLLHNDPIMLKLYEIDQEYFFGDAIDFYVSENWMFLNYFQRKLFEISVD